MKSEDLKSSSICQILEEILILHKSRQQVLTPSNKYTLGLCEKLAERTSLKIQKIWDSVLQGLAINLETIISDAMEATLTTQNAYLSLIKQFPYCKNIYRSYSNFCQKHCTSANLPDLLEFDIAAHYGFAVFPHLPLPPKDDSQFELKNFNVEIESHQVSRSFFSLKFIRFSIFILFIFFLLTPTIVIIILLPIFQQGWIQSLSFVRDICFVKFLNYLISSFQVKHFYEYLGKSVHFNDSLLLQTRSSDYLRGQTLRQQTHYTLNLLYTSMQDFEFIRSYKKGNVDFDKARFTFYEEDFPFIYHFYFDDIDYTGSTPCTLR